MASEIYQNIYRLVRAIPIGRVMTYGQIAALVPGCTPRMTGYALAASKKDDDLPWWRVINSRGEIGFPQGHTHNQLQRQLLESEGILFNPAGRINLDIYRWSVDKK